MEMEPAGGSVGRFDWERALRDADDVTGTRLLVLLALATWMSSDGTGARPSQVTLASATGLSDRAVRAHLTAAVEAGWLVRTERGHGSRYGAATASAYRAALPTTGTAVPVVEPDNRNEDAGSCLQPEPQPEPGRSTTGTPVPTTKVDHVQEERARPIDIARRLVDRSRGELPAILSSLALQHGETTTAAALQHLADAGTRFKYPSELKAALTSAITAVARAQHQAEIDDTRRRVAEIPPDIDPSQAERARQLKAELAARRAS